MHTPAVGSRASRPRRPDQLQRRHQPQPRRFIFLEVDQLIKRDLSAVILRLRREVSLPIHVRRESSLSSS
jgi:hypothetical protein